MIRRPEHADDVREAGGEPVECDLEAADVDAVAAAIEGADAVVFAAGAGPGSGAARKETMDYGGAVKLIDAAKQAGVARYVIVSSRGADADAPATTRSPSTCGPRAGPTPTSPPAGSTTRSSARAG